MSVKNVIVCGFCGAENTIISDWKIKSFVCNGLDCGVSITIGKTEITAKDSRPCVSTETIEELPFAEKEVKNAD